jgi:hypothetical protein
MTLFTIETTYRLPVYRHRTYEADTFAEACRLAIEDDDWTHEKHDFDSAGENYISGAWEGRDVAYRAPAVPVPSHYQETAQRQVEHFTVLLELVKGLIGASQPTSRSFCATRRLPRSPRPKRSSPAPEIPSDPKPRSIPMPTYRLGSSPLINAPGIVARAINGYAFERDRPVLLRVVAEGWPSIPEDHVSMLLSTTVPYDVDGDTVVFTVTDQGSARTSDAIRFEGHRVDGTFVVTAFGAAGEIAVLNPRTDLRNHSPTGFAWGYAGSGPAQLALALLSQVLGDDARAVRLYQRFKDSVIAKLGTSWCVTEAELLGHVRCLEEEADRKQ